MENRLEEIELEDFSDSQETIDDIRNQKRLENETSFRNMILKLVFIVVVMISGIILLVTVQSLVKNDYDRALKIHTKAPFIDVSNSLPFTIREYFDGNISVVNDTSYTPEELNTNITMLKDAVITGVVWSIHEPCNLNRSESEFIRSGLTQIDIAHRLVNAEQNIEMVFQPGASSDISLSKDVHTFTSLSIRGGHLIADDLSVLRTYKHLGAIYMSLVDMCSTSWAETSNPYNTIHKDVVGITKFGETVIKEMNQLKMLIDIGHLSSRAQKKVLSLSKSPVITTMSGVYNISSFYRNLRDDVLKEIGKNDGVVFVPLSPPAICQDVASIYETYMADEISKDELIELYNEISDSCTVKEYVKHLKYLKDLIGINHIGIASNFDDGSPIKIKGLDATHALPYITAELLAEDFSLEEIRKIIGENLLRVWKQANSIN